MPCIHCFRVASALAAVWIHTRACSLQQLVAKGHDRSYSLATAALLWLDESISETCAYQTAFDRQFISTLSIPSKPEGVQCKAQADILSGQQ